MRNDIFKKLTFLLSLYFIFSFGFIFSHGFYTFWGSILILISLILFFIFLFKPDILPWQISGSKFITLLKWALFLNINLTFLLYGGLYQTYKPAIDASRFFLTVLLISSFILLVKIKFNYLNYLIYFFLGLWVILQILMVVSSPSPKIDVYEFLRTGPLELIKGHNPYSAIYKKIYINVEPNCYAYLPFMIFFTLPFVLLFRDPRYAFIFAQIFTFWFLAFKPHWENKKFGRTFSLLLAALILFQPLSLYMTEQSYTEALIVLEMLLIYYYFAKRSKITGFFLGILLATKQYAIFILPFLYKTKQFKTKYFLSAFFTCALLIAPFLINWQDFFYDTILTQYQFLPRYEGLTFFSTLFNIYHISYPFIVAIFIWLIAGIFLYRIKFGNNNSFIFKYMVFLLIFFYFNKWSFLNYYYLISNLLLLLIYSYVYEIQT